MTYHEVIRVRILFAKSPYGKYGKTGVLHIEDHNGEHEMCIRHSCANDMGLFGYRKVGGDELHMPTTEKDVVSIGGKVFD